MSLKTTLDYSQIPGRKGKVDICVLNPKCVTLSELYGCLLYTSDAADDRYVV